MSIINYDWKNNLPGKLRFRKDFQKSFFKNRIFMVFYYNGNANLWPVKAIFLIFW